MRKAITVTLLTIFLAGCHNKEIQTNVPRPPDEYLSCDAFPVVPPIAPLTPVMGPSGATVYLKTETDARDVKVSRFILQIRAAWFDCYQNLAKVRGYYEAAE